MSVQAGFNSTIGVLLALLVVFVVLPLLFCAGLVRVLPDPPQRAPAAPAPVVRPEPVRFDPPRFQADADRIAPGERVWPADPKPLRPIREPPAEPKVDPETLAARKLSLARSLQDPRKRKAWLEEIIRDYPETDAAAEAARMAGEIRE
jgi:hypothetical protein